MTTTQKTERVKLGNWKLRVTLGRPKTGIIKRNVVLSAHSSAELNYKIHGDDYPREFKGIIDGTYYEIEVIYGS